MRRDRILVGAQSMSDQPTKVTRYAMPICKGGALAVPEETEHGYWMMYADHDNLCKRVATVLRDAVPPSYFDHRQCNIWYGKRHAMLKEIES